MTRLKELCDRLEEKLPLSNSKVFSGFDIPEDLPWRDKMSDRSNMYACLYGLAKPFKPLNILEIGTGWGLSLMTWLRLGAWVCSLDVGGFQKDEYHADNLFMVHRTLRRYSMRYWLNKTDTQTMYGAHSIPTLGLHWYYDVLFIDGDHGCKERPWALFNDLWTFWPYLSPGGLCICDDMHNPLDYPSGRFPWLGYTWDSFEMFAAMLSDQIADEYVWDFPFVPSGKRPVGLLVKK